MSALELYLAFVVLAFAGLLFFAPAYYDRSHATAFERRFGAPWGPIVGAAFLAVAVAIALAVAGDLPFEPGASRSTARSRAWSLLLRAALLIAGFVGLVVGASNALTLVRFRRRGDAPTGEVTPGPVAVTGVVAAEDPPRTPFFGAEAVAREWRIRARNRHGGSNDNWSTPRTGGGVPFLLDDGTGPVRVDPDGARLDLTGETVREVPADAYPGRVGTEATAHVDLEFGGDRRRYRETALTPGTEVTVLGTAVERDGGVVVADGDPETPFVVGDGPRSVAVRRYAYRAVGFTAGGLLATYYALSLLADFLAV